MKWSNQKLPGLDDIFDRHDSPHAIVGAAVSIVDDRANVQLSDALKSAQEDATALYVHIPFCPSRCLSCDHLTIIEHDHRAIDRYLDSLSTELSLMAQSSRGALLINRIHIGGGSPNYLSDGQMARLMGSIHTAFTVSPDAEISMEINPRRTSRYQLELLHGLGVRNLHLEVRDVDAKVQNELGRTQSFSLLEDVYGIAREMKFDSINMDLVFGLPGQTSQSIKGSIALIAELGPDMLVCQQYTRRPQQFPHQAAIDERAMPSIAEKLAIFNAVAVGLEDEGYDWVGLNAFVRPNKRVQPNPIITLILKPHGDRIKNSEFLCDTGHRAFIDRCLVRELLWSARILLTHEHVGSQFSDQRNATFDALRCLTGQTEHEVHVDTVKLHFAGNAVNVFEKAK